MSKMCRWIGQGMRYGTLAICVLAVLVGVSRGQFKGGGGGGPRPPQPMPQPPRPPQPQPFVPGPRPDPFINQPGPVFVTEWFCTRCRHVLGQGPVKPAVATCPACGASFIGGGGGGGFGGGNPPPGGPVVDFGQRNAPEPGQVDAPNSLLFFLIAGSMCGFVGLIGLVGGGIFLYVCLSGIRKTPRKRRPRRRDDDDLDL